MNFYNEHDPFAAQWLRNLMAEGHIPQGVVDERDIRDLDPEELREFAQVHLFAGIAGWSVALRLAGWPDDRTVWTGSCPCQPFSSAGKQRGTDDERHLWPVMFELVRECAPPVVAGEQVASKAGLAWLDLVSADLEAEGYAFGAADLCAAGVGAPHIRQRLLWVGHANRIRAWGHGRGVPRAETPRDSEGGEAGRLGDGPGDAGVTSYWADPDWVLCGDPGGARWRPIESGAFPLADGVPGRVGRLRAYGNAIVPQVAAEFIGAFMEASA